MFKMKNRKNQGIFWKYNYEKDNRLSLSNEKN